MLVQGVKKHSVWVVFLGQRSVSKVFSLCYYYFPVVCYGNFILILLILNLLVFTIPILQIEFYISFVCCGKWEVLLHDIYVVCLSVLPVGSLADSNSWIKWQGKLQDRMAGGKEEYNAFFYSLVSTDTQVYIYFMSGHILLIIGSCCHLKIILKLLFKEFMVYCIVLLSFTGDVLLN